MNDRVLMLECFASVLIIAAFTTLGFSIATFLFGGNDDGEQVHS